MRGNADFVISEDVIYLVFTIKQWIFFLFYMPMRITEYKT